MWSMTGYGEAELETPTGYIKIEIKSQNHKFKEIIFNLPAGFSFLEKSLKNKLDSIRRGRINFSLQILAPIKRKVLVDRDLLKSYIERIKEIEKDFGLEKTLNLNTLLTLPGIFYFAEDKIEKEKIFSSINILAKKAIENLISSKKREGEAIFRELKERIKIIEDLFGIIKKRQRYFLKEKRKTFTKPEDWEIFLKNTDITEEIARLNFHLKNFKKIALIKSRSIGKELDFISQELMREANTMQTKSQDKEIIFNLIGLKSEIEKIREQLQNVE